MGPGRLPPSCPWHLAATPSSAAAPPPVLPASLPLPSAADSRPGPRAAGSSQRQVPVARQRPPASPERGPGPGRLSAAEASQGASGKAGASCNLTLVLFLQWGANE
ncbi:uncharacterized protein LOC128812218 isoform X2 [Vidua macroura]|uniref:uncharacterized protein LOC128812218 isoform X2 n=1 Tax=Vidua macroura TaxID=187451 RepID=UPI0023A872DB|nr:uncharacterized protein LOC128812218 isoform X2 [Vidua macroura]